MLNLCGVWLQMSVESLIVQLNSTLLLNKLEAQTIKNNRVQINKALGIF